MMHIKEYFFTSKKQRFLRNMHIGFMNETIYDAGKKRQKIFAIMCKKYTDEKYSVA